MARTAITATTQQIEEAREDMIAWLCECYEEDGEEEEINDCDTATLARVVNKTYDGGLNAFLRDCNRL
jgi:hypothetical protein